MGKLHVVSVVGTRPEIIRLSEILKELDRVFNHTIIHTGQNYDFELSEIFFNELGIRKPDYFLDSAGKTTAETVGNIIARSSEALEKENPDALLVLGDTNSALAAYSAKRLKIPVFHMEAGNRCFDERVPEEINRRIVDHISDINLVYSSRARDFLLREGFSPDRVIKTGSPMFEVLTAHKSSFDSSQILENLKLVPHEYFVLSAHREENVSSKESLTKLISAIQSLSKKYKFPIIFSVHPRTRKRIEDEKIKLPKEVQLLKPLGFSDYITLQREAFCTISDSGTISEESAILNFPAVNIRETHERLEAMDESAVIMAGLNPERVLQAVEYATQQNREVREFSIPADYTSPNVSKKVARIIMSYTDYVNRVVWGKN